MKDKYTLSSNDIDAIIKRAYSLIEEGKQIEATDLFIDQIDFVINNGGYKDYIGIANLLSQLDVNKLPVMTITGILFISRREADRFGLARIYFFQKAMKALMEIHGFTHEQCKAIAKRLE